MKKRLFTERMFTLLTLAAGLFLFSCNKNDSEIDQPLVEGLTIDLQSGMDINTVDSVDVIFSRVGSAARIRKRLVLNPTTRTFYAGWQGLTAGTWNADIQVYGKMDDEDQRLVYGFSTQLQVAQNIGSVIKGPKGLFQDMWKPRISFATNSGNLMAIIPLSPDDNYLELSIREQIWDYIYVDRIHYRTVNGQKQPVGAIAWEDTENLGQPGFIKKDLWTGYVNEMNNKTWESGSVMMILIDDATNEEILFYYEYEK